MSYRYGEVRHFYLRDHKNHNAVCVAAQVDAPDVDKLLQVRFAVATYNPHDVKLGLKRNTNMARNKATGRLKSKNKKSPDNMLIELSFHEDEPPSPQFHRVMTAICRAMMLGGVWAAAHPAACSAHDAAAIWVNQQSVIYGSTSTPKSAS